MSATATEIAKGLLLRDAVGVLFSLALVAALVVVAFAVAMITDWQRRRDYQKRERERKGGGR